MMRRPQNGKRRPTTPVAQAAEQNPQRVHLLSWRSVREGNAGASDVPQEMWAVAIDTAA